MPWKCPKCNYSNDDAFTDCACGFVKGSDDGLKACPSCKKTIPLEDQYCSYCGKVATVLSTEDKHKIRKASNWILAISILFVIFGTIFGFQQISVAEDAKKNLAQYDDSQVWDTPVNGKEYTVGELRDQIDLETIVFFGTNYFLAFGMFGIYLWSKRSPFPAMITALCLYLSIIVLNAIIDPSTIIQGIIIKVIFFSAILSGIKTSLVARGLSQTQISS